MNLSNNASSEEPDWIVNGILVAHAPAVIGGAVKSLKSSIATELAVCVTASEPVKFLNHFDADNGCRVLYLNYEGTRSEVEDRFRRVINARGRVKQGCLAVLPYFPPLDNDEGLDKLERALDFNDGDFSIVIVDPVYRAFPSTDFTSPNRGGSPLAAVHDVCREFNSTPIFVHHNVKHGSGHGLELLSGSGLAEIVGQWMLVDSRGCYDHENGRHRLRLEVGGRAGHGGRYDLEVIEGRLDDPGGRRWETVVTPFSARPARENVEDGNGQAAIISGLAEDVFAYIAANPDSTIRGIRAGFEDKKSHRSVSQAVKTLVAEGRVEGVEVMARGNRTTGYRAGDVGLTRD